MGVLTSLQIGSRGLSAASMGIDVTSQNVTNATTEGYSRRVLGQATADPLHRGGLWVGQGVALTGIRRMSDRLLGARLLQASGGNEYASSLESALKVTEAYFDESSSTGVVEAYDGFFDALTAASADPGDPSLRQASVSAASTFASVLSRTASGLEDTVSGLDSAIGSGLDTINDQLSQIASLNARIGATGGANASADLLDQRDQLILEVSKATGATAELGADGDATVFLGGHAIVSGDAARTLSVEEDTNGVPQVYLSSDDAKLRVSDEVGGSLGGLVEARDRTQGYLDTLDDFAFTFANAVNTQSAAGYAADGTPGGNIFTVSGTVDGAASSLAVDATLLGDPDRLAFAGDPAAEAGDATNLVALQSLETDATMFATGTGHDVLSSLVTTVGADVAGAGDEVDSTAAVLSDLSSVRDAVSGVDTDEEAVKLIEYQAAYRAASSLISAANDMLQDLMAMV